MYVFVAYLLAPNTKFYSFFVIDLPTTPVSIHCLRLLVGQRYNSIAVGFLNIISTSCLFVFLSFFLSFFVFFFAALFGTDNKFSRMIYWYSLVHCVCMRVYCLPASPILKFVCGLVIHFSNIILPTGFFCFLL